jgi:hypothetical protein
MTKKQQTKEIETKHIEKTKKRKKKKRGENYLAVTNKLTSQFLRT